MEECRQVHHTCSQEWVLVDLHLVETVIVTESETEIATVGIVTGIDRGIDIQREIAYLLGMSP